MIGVYLHVKSLFTATSSVGIISMHNEAEVLYFGWYNSFSAGQYLGMSKETGQH